MESREKEKRQTEVIGLKAYLLGRLALCDGYDDRTRKELIQELIEYEYISAN